MKSLRIFKPVRIFTHTSARKPIPTLAKEDYVKFQQFFAAIFKPLCSNNNLHNKNEDSIDLNPLLTDYVRSYNMGIRIFMIYHRHPTSIFQRKQQ